MWAGEKITYNRLFHHNILFSDECSFSTNGVVSSQHCRYWARKNPEFKINVNNQKYKKVNVWCGIYCDKIIGPYFFDVVVNQHSYLNMLQDFLLPALEDITLEKRQQMYFQQDGCPAHSTLLIQNFLDVHFSGKWIGRFGPVHWPARSPDLTPLDFF